MSFLPREEQKNLGPEHALPLWEPQMPHPHSRGPSPTLSSGYSHSMDVAALRLGRKAFLPGASGRPPLQPAGPPSVTAPSLPTL